MSLASGGPTRIRESHGLGQGAPNVAEHEPRGAAERLCQRALQPFNGWLLFTTTFSAADTTLLTECVPLPPADRAVAAHEPRCASSRLGSVIATVRGRERAQSEFQPSRSPGALSKPTAMIPLDCLGDNLDMHSAACTGVRWHNPLTLAGSMHCPSSWLFGNLASMLPSCWRTRWRRWVRPPRAALHDLNPPP